MPKQKNQIVKPARVNFSARNKLGVQTNAAVVTALIALKNWILTAPKEYSGRENDSTIDANMALIAGYPSISEQRDDHDSRLDQSHLYTKASFMPGTAPKVNKPWFIIDGRICGKYRMKDIKLDNGVTIGTGRSDFPLAASKLQGDWGYDIGLPNVVIPAGFRGIIPTGICYVGDGKTKAQIFSRSSTLGKGLTVMPGLVDADYIGPLGIICHNSTGRDLPIPFGTMVAQIVFYSPSGEVMANNNVITEVACVLDVINEDIPVEGARDLVITSFSESSSFLERFKEDGGRCGKTSRITTSSLDDEMESDEEEQEAHSDLVTQSE